MAKRNNKVAKGAKAATGANGDALPTFDDNALSALTAKIEKGFGGGAPAKADQASQPKEKKGSKSRNGLVVGKDKWTTRSPAVSRGTKRDAHGNAKVDAKSRPAKKPQEAGSKDARAVLLEEILALGGTAEDLDLVVDAVSDVEDDAPAQISADKTLQKELAKFVAGLGIEGQSADANEESADEAKLEHDLNSEDEAGWEEASSRAFESSDDTAEAVPQRKQAAPALPNASSHNDPNRLVSSLSVVLIGLTDC
jgi:ribosome biogenesis protein MAK21